MVKNEIKNTIVVRAIASMHRFTRESIPNIKITLPTDITPKKNYSGNDSYIFVERNTTYRSGSYGYDPHF